MSNPEVTERMEEALARYHERVNAEIEPVRVVRIIMESAIENYDKYKREKEQNGTAISTANPKPGFRVQGFGFRVSGFGSGCRIWGLGV